MASSVHGAARGEVIIGAESTGGSGVGSRGATLGEGRGDSTSGTVCTVRPPGVGRGRCGELVSTPRGKARRGVGGSE
jgi:hypothetical protein